MDTSKTQRVAQTLAYLIVKTIIEGVYIINIAQILKKSCKKCFFVNFFLFFL